MSEDSPRLEPTFYEQLAAADIVDPILKPFMEGKIIADLKTQKLSLHRYIALNRTWILAKVCSDRKCGKWLGVYYSYYNILPPPCKQCWKVVYAPQTLIELFEVQKFQAKMDLPAKCGTEARDYTSGLGGYRAFWYCPFYGGLDGARRHFDRIKSAMIKHFGEELIQDRLDRGLLFLKRGCTEFERDFGPSDKWDKIDFSAKFNLLETVWEDPEEMEREWPPLVYTNLKRWIEYAVAHGDKSALEFVRGKKLGVPAVTYHNSKHESGQFKNFVGGEEKDESASTETKTDLFRFES